jgi:hypothetical protein
MEEAPENGKELLNSVHANGMNEDTKVNIIELHIFSTSILCVLAYLEINTLIM